MPASLFLDQTNPPVRISSAATYGAIMRLGAWAVLIITAVVFTPAVYAGNDVMGEIEFDGKSKVEKTSGVWIDGQYVGYLKELKGSKKILLLPGEHQVAVRQSGYNDFTQKVVVEPGQTQLVHVTMQKASGATAPKVSATLKVDIQPSRAAVFIDDAFLG